MSKYAPREGASKQPSSHVFSPLAAEPSAKARLTAAQVIGGLEQSGVTQRSGLLRTLAALPAQPSPDTRLRIAQIIGDPKRGIAPLLPIGRTFFYALIASGDLPKPEKFGRTSLWRYGDLMIAIEKLGVEA